MTEKRQRRVVILVAVILGVAMGAWATPKILFKWYLNGTIKKNSWTTHPLIGSGSAHPYLNAVIAVGGLYAMRNTEAAYWSIHELDGEPLSNKCRYRVSGGKLPARFWTLTLYDKDSFLIPNRWQRYVLDGRRIGWDSGQSWTIYIDREMQGNNWLPSYRHSEIPLPQTEVKSPVTLPGEKDNLRLFLRLYHPSKHYLENIQAIDLPTVEKLECPWKS